MESELDGCLGDPRQSQAFPLSQEIHSRGHLKGGEEHELQSPPDLGSNPCFPLPSYVSLG